MAELEEPVLPSLGPYLTYSDTHDENANFTAPPLSVPHDLITANSQETEVRNAARDHRDLFSKIAVDESHATDMREICQPHLCYWNYGSDFRDFDMVFRSFTTRKQVEDEIRTLSTLSINGAGHLPRPIERILELVRGYYSSKLEEDSQESQQREMIQGPTLEDFTCRVHQSLKRRLMDLFQPDDWAVVKDYTVTSPDKEVFRLCCHYCSETIVCSKVDSGLNITKNKSTRMANKSGKRAPRVQVDMSTFARHLATRHGLALRSPKSIQAGCAAVVPVQLASMPDGTPLPALWQMDAPLEVPQVQAFDYSAVSPHIDALPPINPDLDDSVSVEPLSTGIHTEAVISPHAASFEST